jgi:ABC-type lipoprotein release transport system permease subunit
MTGALRAAVRRLRARPGRSGLAALGIVAAGAMLGTATTLSYGLGTGWERAAQRADLPDVIARFDPERIEEVESRVRRLPNLQARAYRLELTGLELSHRGRRVPSASAHIVREGRRGYAIVEGRDVTGRPGEVVVERGLAREWDLVPGDEIRGGQGGAIAFRVVGIAVSPDTVSYPLASKPRLYFAYESLRRFGDFAEPVNVALLWVNDPERTDVLLGQARAVGYGIADLRFATQEGVRLLVDQAGGLVIALLVAFSVVALGSALVMLGASAQAEVARRLETLGVMRALGVSRAGVVWGSTLEALVVAVPAGVAGVALGGLLAAGPSAGLLETLGELAPGRALLVPLALVALGLVAVVAGATAWPAWRAVRRPPALLLRGAELPAMAPGGRLGSLPGGAGLGARMAASRRGRLAGTVCVLAISSAVVLLLLALAGLLERLEDDPGVLGKRYELTADLPAHDAGRVEALPGVAAAAPRYVVEAADSFQLGARVRLVAYPGDHTPYEAPPLAEGRRLRGPREAELGLGLAERLGVGVGGTLATQLPSGAEVRFRVVGLVRALENEGQVAYTRSRPLVDASPGLDPDLAVVLEPGADRPAVERGLRELGATLQPAGGAVSRRLGFLGVLASLLRVVALVNGVVCLYALVQALALTAVERRGSLAVLRACGAGRREVTLVLLGAAGLVVALAAPVGVVLERLLLGPLVGRLAVDYAALSLGASPAQVLLVLLGLAGMAATAALWVARRIEREPIVAGLREE